MSALTTKLQTARIALAEAEMRTNKMSQIATANLAKIIANDLSAYEIGKGIRIQSPGYNKNRIYWITDNDGKRVSFDGKDGLVFSLDATNIRFYEARNLIQIVAPKMSDSQWADYEDYVASANEALSREVR